jgi:hypothetical protein
LGFFIEGMEQIPLSSALEQQKVLPSLAKRAAGIWRSDDRLAALTALGRNERL